VISKVWPKFVPKSDLFEVEGILDDTRGGDAHTEDVLLRGQVVGLCYSVNVRQVAEIQILHLNTSSPILITILKDQMFSTLKY
jgi:hypothetical protein